MNARIVVKKQNGQNGYNDTKNVVLTPDMRHINDVYCNDFVVNLTVSCCRFL